MSDTNTLTLLLLEKVEQQIELAIELLALVPGDQLGWQPVAGTFRLSQLLGHLLEAAAGFCAALYRFKPEELAGFERLRTLPVNHDCGVEEAAARLRDYLAHIRRGFATLDDRDLARRWPTAFAPAGEAALTILLTNLEHFINHKHQLFFYLKLLGVEVATAELYKIKTPPAT
ncbi:MAG TPA: DinB family protein [Blastocatellia bacterium]|nr:DinB family protein [Blastocatellia bacterium]